MVIRWAEIKEDSGGESGQRPLQTRLRPHKRARPASPVHPASQYEEVARKFSPP